MCSCDDVASRTSTTCPKSTPRALPSALSTPRPLANSSCALSLSTSGDGATTPWADERRLQALLHDLSVRRRQVYTVDDLKALEYEATQERFHLEHQIETFEVSLHDAKHETDIWRRRCLDKERDCEAITCAEKAVRRELADTRDQKQQLEWLVDELRQSRDQAEAFAKEAETQGKAYHRELEMLDRLLKDSNSKLEAARTELRDTIHQSATLQEAARKVECDLRHQLDMERTIHTESARLAEERQRLLESHIEKLEQELSSALANLDNLAEERRELWDLNAQLTDANDILRAQLREAAVLGATLGVRPIYLGKLPNGDAAIMDCTPPKCTPAPPPGKPKPRRASAMTCRSPKEALLMCRPTRGCSRSVRPPSPCVRERNAGTA